MTQRAFWALSLLALLSFSALELNALLLQAQLPAPEHSRLKQLLAP